MPNLVVFEAIEQHLRCGIRHVAAVPFGDEQNIGRVGGPDAAKANLDSRKLRCLIPEDLPLIENTIVIGILKNQDSILQACVEVHLALDVGVALCHPQPPAAVPRHRDRLLHRWLGRTKLDLETIPQRDAYQCIGRLQKRRGDLLGVDELLLSRIQQCGAKQTNTE